MKFFTYRKLSVILLLLFCFQLGGCTASQSTENASNTENNEIEIAGAVDGKVEGAESVDHTIDVTSSPYFLAPNYYNGKVSDTLLLLDHFKTYQQTSERSCGAACVIMIANYLNQEVLSEDVLDKEMDIRYYDNPREDGSYGASTKALVKAFESRGYTVTSSLTTADSNGYSFQTAEEFAQYIKKQLTAKAPTMVENVEWGGHWMVIIGYDDMGTETMLDDVLVFADPYDTTDQSQDGYYTRNFMKFYSEWFDANVMSKSESIQQYITVSK